ncbi:hypothetical protein ERX37_09985 [Macrococcus hajekii]|uniref:Uncharacterized protein n=1 Tax=Macrococcus hajekii TaxID=198482 RepID=A0A4R6BI51_9STAP|nr:DUF5327 family protein [Macrococcus hajekii]TDM01201.1 hypothetical protein ERX37_09985 [Macrococcus hajekii]GGB11734.1 hypothetical protein GCM10007190_19740 [Macrococcus hajekii]
MKAQIINQIMTELEKARTSEDNEFSKHMYAIQTLASLGSCHTYQNENPGIKAHKEEISPAELKLMGGQPLKSIKAETDDGLGNGKSLFDF